MNDHFYSILTMQQMEFKCRYHIRNYYSFDYGFSIITGYDDPKFAVYHSYYLGLIIATYQRYKDRNIGAIRYPGHLSLSS